MNDDDLPSGDDTFARIYAAGFIAALAYLFILGVVIAPLFQ